MKPYKNILIIMVSLIASGLFLYFMWMKVWQPLSNMTELGYLELTPVAKATKPITVGDGQESTQYYVVVAVDTKEGERQLYIEIEEAYEEEDLVKCLNSYRAKKKVGGYYFYSETNREAYFSKEISTAKEYMKNSAKGVIDVVIVINATIIAVIILMAYMGRMKLPFIPGGNWGKDQLIVCRYNNATYGFLALMCIAMGGGMIVLSGYLLTSAENMDTLLPGLMFIPLAVAFLAMGILFMLFMKYYALVIYPKGIVYRNAIGRTWFFTDEEVQYVSVIHAYRNHSFRIQTKEKNIWINYYCTNYNRAERYLEQKYPNMETYKQTVDTK